MEHQKLFDKYSEGRHWEQHPTIYAERFAEFLASRQFLGVLVDLGCSTGRDVAAFHQQKIKTIGVDISEEEIEKAKEKYPSGHFEVQNVESLKFASESVDACFMINVIHYVDQQKALAEIRRVLKPNGYFFVHFNMEIKDQHGKVDLRETRQQIEKLLEGWRVVSSNEFERHDTKPVPHTHKILELILQK